METIINIYIYVLLILVCVTVSVAYIKSRSTIRQTQQAVEELSLTMNDMVKKIRMSSCPTAGGCVSSDQIRIAPNEAPTTVLTYKINGTNLEDAASGGQLIMENIGGTFTATNTGVNQIPLIQIKFWRWKKGSTTVRIPGTDIQTSVSMRSGYSIE